MKYKNLLVSLLKQNGFNIVSNNKYMNVIAV